MFEIYGNLHILVSTQKVILYGFYIILTIFIKPIFHQKLCSRTKRRQRDEIDMSNANPALAYPM